MHSRDGREWQRYPAGNAVLQANEDLNSEVYHVFERGGFNARISRKSTSSRARGAQARCSSALSPRVRLTRAS